MSRGGTLRQSQTWRVLPLSTGEVTLATKIAEERGRRAHAGQGVRMLDIPADAGRGSGVFDHPGPDKDAGKLAQAIKHAATTDYGVAGPAFIRCLLEDGPDDVRELVREMIDAFVADNLPFNADGQVKRAAERLGLIGAAGELAREWGIVPWEEGGPERGGTCACRLDRLPRRRDGGGGARGDRGRFAASSRPR